MDVHPPIYRHSMGFLVVQRACIGFKVARRYPHGHRGHMDWCGKSLTRVTTRFWDISDQSEVTLGPVGIGKVGSSLPEITSTRARSP
jgi:hypothetical protein